MSQTRSLPLELDNVLDQKLAPRIHVLLAREAPIGLVIRRGPSKQVCTLLWNRLDDSFALGQWLKGRIYERRCDLSPDGAYFVYFALDGRWDSEAKGAYTAISRAPYLKAIGLWAKGDAWHGGGLFTSRTSYWLNRGYGHHPVRVPSELTETPDYPGANTFGGEDLGVYYLRLQRDGWRLVERQRVAKDHGIDVFEKSMPGGGLLRKLAHSTSGRRNLGQGCYYHEHEIETPHLQQRIALAGWEWADLDGSRLVWSESGCLFAGEVGENGVIAAKQLYDFGPMSFQPIVAPY